MANEKDQRKVKGGLARAQSLTAEERKEIARKAAQARWAGELPVVTHEGEFKIGDTIISCAVLPNGKRIITQASFLRAIGRSRSPKAGTGIFSTVDGVPFFLQAKALMPFVSEDLIMSTTPIFYRTLKGGKGVGYDGALLPRVAEVYLKYRDDRLVQNGNVPRQYQHIVAAADILIRGLANVGIIALIDEATGFQRDRASDALARILEEFIAKELQPWVRTFPEEYYEELFRLRGLKFPRDPVKRPRYFGHLTNDVIYKRLAPGVLAELKRTTPKAASGRHRHQLHRRLTPDLGHPKLREHMASVVTAMKLSDDYDDFVEKMDRLHPRYDKSSVLDFPDDGGEGL